MQKEKLRSILLDEDVKRSRKEGNNIYRIGIMLNALKDASLDPDGLTAGINKCFCGRLRVKLLRACGVDPKQFKETTNWCR